MSEKQINFTAYSSIRMLKPNYYLFLLISSIILSVNALLPTTQLLYRVKRRCVCIIYLLLHSSRYIAELCYQQSAYRCTRH